MLETFFAVVGAIAIVGAAVVLWRYFSSLDRRLKAHDAFLHRLDDVGAKRRLEELEEKREFGYAGEIDGLSRKVNALSNYGRTLELTGPKIERLAARVTRLETEIPPAPQNPIEQSAADRPTDAGIGGEDPTAPSGG